MYVCMYVCMYVYDNNNDNDYNTCDVYSVYTLVPGRGWASRTRRSAAGSPRGGSKGPGPN